MVPARATVDRGRATAIAPYAADGRGSARSAIARPAPISAWRSSQVFCRFSQSCGVVPKYRVRRGRRSQSPLRRIDARTGRVDERLNVREGVRTDCAKIDARTGRIRRETANAGRGARDGGKTRAGQANRPRAGRPYGYLAEGEPPVQEGALGSRRSGRSGAYMPAERR